MEIQKSQQNINPLGPPPENYLVWAILATVMCCIPLGIVAIIKSSKVNELWARGDAFGAHKAANDAKKYAIWSAVIVPVIVIAFYLFALIFGLAGAILST